MTWAWHGLPTVPPGFRPIELPRLLIPPGQITFSFLFALLLVRRGAMHARASIEFDDLEDAFRRGLLGLLGLVLMARLALPNQYGLVQAAAAPYALAFFFMALTGLAVARLSAERRRRAGEPSAPLARGWLLVLVGVVTALLVLSLTASSVVSLDLLAGIVAAVLRPIAIVLVTAMLVIALPFAYAAAWLIERIREALAARAGEGGTGMPFAEFLRQLGERRRDPIVPSDEAILAVEWVLLAVAVVGIGLALAAALRWWRAREEEEGVEEERESVWSWQAAASSLREWLARLFGLQRAEAAVATVSPPPVTVPDGPPTLANIRAIYRELLALAAARGRARPPAATPGEHLPALQAALDPDDDLAALTAEYARARYGAAPPDETALSAAREGLARVRAATIPPTQEDTQ